MCFSSVFSSCLCFSSLKITSASGASIGLVGFALLGLLSVKSLLDSFGFFIIVSVNCSVAVFIISIHSDIFKLATGVPLSYKLREHLISQLDERSSLKLIMAS